MLDAIVKLEKKILKELESEYKRYLYEKIDFSSQMIAIVGARGVGKTTLLLQYAKELKSRLPSYKTLYFSYDFPTNVDIKLYELAEEFTKIGGEYLLLDEIHKYKNFALDLKAIYDFYPQLKVVFTGSCAASIYNSQADLSRRVVLYHMNGLSYREFLELLTGGKFESYKLDEILSNHIDITDKIGESFVPLEHFGTYLQKGYYPFYFRDKEQYLKLLSAVINLTIDVDLVGLELIKPSYINKLKKLLSILCGSEPFELNITKVAANIEVSRNTLYSYLQHLKNSELVNMITNAKKGISSLSKPEKLYLNNTNIFYALCDEPKIGTVRETFFANQLSQNHKLHSTKNGDFIIDEKYTIEIGGEKKGFGQIKNIPDSYVAADTDTTENQKKIPLWLFGFLY